MDSYEKAVEQFKAGYNVVMTVNPGKDAAAKKLAELVASMKTDILFKAEVNTPFRNGQITALRELIAA